MTRLLVYEMPNRCHACIIEINVILSIFHVCLINIRHTELSTRLLLRNQWFFFNRNNAFYFSPWQQERVQNSRLVFSRQCACTLVPSILIERRYVDACHVCDGRLVSASQKLDCQIYTDTLTECAPIFCCNYASGSPDERTRSTCNNYLRPIVLLTYQRSPWLLYFHYSNWYSHHVYIYSFSIINSRTYFNSFICYCFVHEIDSYNS